jgi:hypothetical protein
VSNGADRTGSPWKISMRHTVATNSAAQSAVVVVASATEPQLEQAIKAIEQLTESNDRPMESPTAITASQLLRINDGSLAGHWAVVSLADSLILFPTTAHL